MIRHVFILLAALPALAQTDRDLRLGGRADTETSVQTRVPRGYAVVVGISRYKNLSEQNNLRFAQSDAEAIYRVLISKEGGGFAAEDVHLLKGSEATLKRIQWEIEEWLPKVAQPQDRVVVYFSGHGVVEEGRGYLVPWDLQPNRVSQTGYPMRTVGNILANRVKARWKALFTDACHSGKINSETTDEGISSQLDAAMGSTQFLSFAASIGKERSFEVEELATGFGLFTYFLVQGLAGEADNDPCDGWVRAGELVEYVREKVRLYAKGRDLTQTPHAGSDYDPSMVLARSSRCGGPPLRRLATAKIDVNLDQVNIWIDDRLIGRASQGTSLLVPGLADGEHTICGKKDGYDTACKQVVIAPENVTGILIQLRYQRPIKPKAMELEKRGEKLLYTRRSTINPVNIAPIPRAQSIADLKAARDLFGQALKEDGSYSQAAYELGVTNQLLSDGKASLAAFRLAIELDRAHVPARARYAGVLIENGDPDEAIRQLTEALRFDDQNSEAYALLARAFLDKGVLDRCVAFGDRALELNDTNEMAHLWRADCLRKIGDAQRSNTDFKAAGEDYRTFLRLTNYSTPVHEWVAYHFIGFGLGGRSHADRKVSFDSLRKAAYLGLCICERKTGNALLAREYCRRAIRIDREDAVAYFVLGLAQLEVFNRTLSCEDAQDAHDSFVKMLSLNSGLQEARHAREYIEKIDGRRTELKSKGCL
jgi:tetratricopeptide (TPR) repeat protein